MKRILYILAALFTLDVLAYGQGSPPLCMSEVDGSPNKCGITRIKVTNGTLSISGSTATITISGGGGGSPGGSTTQVQYNNTGAFAGAAGFTFNGTSTITLGVAGTSVGAVAFKNATSGTVTLQPVTGALGTVTLSLPAATDTLAVLGTSQTFTALQKFNGTASLQGQLSAGDAAGWTAPATLNTPGWSKPFMTLAANSPTTGSNTLVMASGDGNSATAITHFLASGSLTSPGNTWVGGIGVINTVGWVGGTVNDWRTFTVIEYGNRGANPAAEGDVKGRIQLGVSNGNGVATRPGLVIYDDHIAATNTVPLIAYNTGYANVFDGPGWPSNNSEVAQVRWVTNVLNIGAAATGTGTLRAVNITGSTVKIANLTTNGFVKTGSGDGTLSVQTATQATAALDAMVGDSGSGGTKGLVPAPAAGDAAAGKFLRADGTWFVPLGGGGGGIPGGSSTQVQYNNGGAFGGITNATSDGTTLTVTSPKIVTSIKDTNGNSWLGITATGSATQFLTLSNNVVGSAITLSANIPTAASASQAGTPVTIAASDAIAGTSSAGAAAGGSLTLTAGNAKRLTSGNGNGGTITLTPGSPIGSGTTGTVDVVGAGFDGSTYYGILQVYNEFTNSSNYSRLRLQGAALTFESAGTGSSASFEFINKTSGDIFFRTNDTRRWKIQASASSNGDFVAVQTDANIRLLTGYLKWDTGLAFASLGTPANGTIVYCTDCKNSVDNAVAVGSVAASGGAGAIVSRINGSWRTMN